MGGRGSREYAEGGAVGVPGSSGWVVGRGRGTVNKGIVTQSEQGWWRKLPGSESLSPHSEFRMAILKQRKQLGQLGGDWL